MGTRRGCGPQPATTPAQPSPAALATQVSVGRFSCKQCAHCVRKAPFCTTVLVNASVGVVIWSNPSNQTHLCWPSPY